MSISFRPLEANLTHNTELIGKMDPYVLFIVGTQKIKSQVCRKGGKHPIWDDVVNIPFAGQTTCLVEVRDKDILIDDRIGHCEIDLAEIQSQGRLKKWYPLFHKDKPAGELLMEAEFGGIGFDAGQPGLLAGTPAYNTTGLVAGAPLIGAGLPTNSTAANLAGLSTAMNQGMNLVGGALPAQTLAPVLNTGISRPEQFAQEALLHGVDPLHSHEATAFNRQAVGSNLGLAPTLGFGGLPQQVQTFGSEIPAPIYGTTPVLGTTTLHQGGLATGIANEVRAVGDRLAGNTYADSGIPGTNMGGLGHHIHNNQATFGHGNP